MAWTKKHVGKTRTSHHAYYRDEAGVTVKLRGGFATKTEARRAGEAAEAAARAQGRRHDPRAHKITLAEYYAEWIEQREMELNTRAHYAKMWRAALGPAFGTSRLRDIDGVHAEGADPQGEHLRAARDRRHRRRCSRRPGR